MREEGRDVPGVARFDEVPDPRFIAADCRIRARRGDHKICDRYESANLFCQRPAQGHAECSFPRVLMCGTRDSQLIWIRWRFEEGDAILKRLGCDTSIAGNDCIDVPKIEASAMKRMG